MDANRAARKEFHALSTQDREPEYEENAQIALADYTLYKLLDSQLDELQKIDSALTRIEQGTFGRCVECEREIPIERLRALSYALLCEEDARRREYEKMASGASLPSL